MASNRLIGTSFFISSIILGCGGGGGSGSTPTNTPPAGEANAALVSSTPVEGAKGVMIDQPLTVVYNTDLDAASINETNIALMPTTADDASHSDDPSLDTMQKIPGTPALGADKKTITFTPAVHLHLGTNYHLRLTKLKTAAGATVPTVSIGFNTINNNELNETRFETRDPATIGLATSYETYEYDANGELTLINVYEGDKTTLVEVIETGPGRTINAKPVRAIAYSVAAGVKTITGYRANAMDPAGTKVIAHVSYDSAGADTQWGTADDTVHGFTDHAHNHIKPNHWTTFVYEPAGTAPVTWTGNLNDPNFRVAAVLLRILDDSMRTVMQVVYSSVGANGIDADSADNPAPVDDVVRSYTRVERDSTTGNRLAEISYGQDDPATPAIEGPGADGKYFTEDDVPRSYQTYEYNATGHLVRRVLYIGPGADQSWTAVEDNDAHSLRNYTYVANDLLSQQVRFDAGPDKKAGTPDDLKAREVNYDTTK